MPTVYNQQTPTFQQLPVYQQALPFYAPQMFSQPGSSQFQQALGFPPFQQIGIPTPFVPTAAKNKRKKKKNGGIAGAQGSQPSQAPFIPQQMPFLPDTGPPAGVAPVQATPVPDQQAPVIQPMEEPNVEGKKAGKCWKCSVDTHATKDCKVQHYCLVCDTGSHPTL
jgi:hypothetical protein